MSYSTLCNAARVTGLLPRHHISSDTASCWRATAMAVALVFLCLCAGADLVVLPAGPTLPV